MKKLITLLLTVCLVVASAFSLVACGGHTHSAKQEWSNDDTHHWHACEGEGCEEQLDKAEHAYVEGTCVCGKHAHTSKQEWSKDNTYHWHACEGCEEKLDKGEHAYVDGACVCGKTEIGQGGGENSGELTNAELSVAYKQAAVGVWEEIGVSDPTVSTQLLVLTVGELPDKKSETTDISQVNNIKVNSNSLAGLLYMTSLLYANENFAVTDGVATFDVTIMLEDMPFAQEYALRTSVDMANNKIYLEVIVTVGGTPQYSYLEVDFDFTAREILAYRLCGTVMGEYYDMAYTVDKKNMWYSTTDLADSFVVALNAKQADLTEKASQTTKLTHDFSEEVQTYFDVLMDVMANM